jgi:hypothetical protein
LAAGAPSRNGQDESKTKAESAPTRVSLGCQYLIV